jgi:hypothetical protein
LLLLPFLPARAQTWRTITSARQLHGESELAVQIEYGAGLFRIRPGAGGELYRLEMRYDEERFTPLRDYERATGRLRLGLQGRDGMRVGLGDRRRGEQPPYLNLELSPDIPLALDLQLGAVESDVELGGLALRSVSYRTGASATRVRFSRPNPVDCSELVLEAGAAELEAFRLANANCARVRIGGGVGRLALDFTGEWRRSMEADVDVGLGSLELRLPQDVGVEVHLSRFLASFDASGFEKRGNVYYSANHRTARRHLTLRVNAAFGGIEVSWVGPD